MGPDASPFASTVRTHSTLDYHKVSLSMKKKLDRSQFETLQKSLRYPVLYCSIMYKSGKFPIKKSITEANGTKLFMGFWSPQYSKHFVALGGNKICSLACQFHHKTNALDHDQHQD